MIQIDHFVGLVQDTFSSFHHMYEQTIVILGIHVTNILKHELWQSSRNKTICLTGYEN